MRKALLTLITPALLPMAALGEDMPDQCTGAYMVQVLGTVNKSCPELSVTANGLLFVSAASKQGAYRGCQDAAKKRLLSEMLTVAESVGGDSVETMQLWCETAYLVSEQSGLELIKRK